MTHECVISTLRVNEVVDRDTFVNMFLTEEALIAGASDLSFDHVAGGLHHKREFRQGCNGLEDGEDYGINQTTDRRCSTRPRSSRDTSSL